MIISITGKPGSGKSTVAKLLAKELRYKRYYIGQLRRDMAKKRNLTIEEYNKLGETDPSTDIEVDEYQKKLGKKEKNFVIEGRTSFYFIPNSFKVYLDVNKTEGAKRIFNDLKKNKKRNEKIYRTIEETRKNIEKRKKSDKKRYKKYYNLNTAKKSNYDLIIDTSHITPKEVVEKILKKRK